MLAGIAYTLFPYPRELSLTEDDYRFSRNNTFVCLLRTETLDFAIPSFARFSEPIAVTQTVSFPLEVSLSPCVIVFSNKQAFDLPGSYQLGEKALQLGFSKILSSMCLFLEMLVVDVITEPPQSRMPLPT